MNSVRIINSCSKVLQLSRYSVRLHHYPISSLCIKRSDNNYYKSLNYLTQYNCIHSKTISGNESKDGFFKSFIKKVGWLPHVKAKLRLSGYLLYENIADQLDYEYWLKENNLPNTFSSWFMITELHVWMLLVRCMAEGDEGRLLRNAIIEAMWADVTVRAKKLAPASTSLVRKQVDTLSEQFQGALICYDEGLMSSDMVFAGAIWRRFFQMTTDDAALVENLVRYTRKQILLLESIPTTEFMNNPKIDWIQLNEK